MDTTASCALSTMETTSPGRLFNSVSLRFPELLRTYQIHREVFDRPLNFDAFFSTVPPGVQKPDQQFLEWFVGFSEGDGCFCVTGDRCIFTITQRDEPLLRLIQQTLGFGSIYPKQRSPGLFEYRVTSLKKDIFPLILLFNGNLVLKKTNERFKSWVANYNRRRGTELLVLSRWNIIFKTVEHLSPGDLAFQEVSLRSTSVVWNSSWLSGFVDAEGCFSVNIRKRDVPRLKLEGIPRFLIAQKGESELVLHVAFLIGLGCFSLVVRSVPDRTLENGIYEFKACSGISLKQIQGYLKKHPLRGKKALSYSKWCQVLVELPKIKRLIRRSRALPRGCGSIMPISRAPPQGRGARSFPHEECEKLLALIRDINPSELKKRVGESKSQNTK